MTRHSVRPATSPRSSSHPLTRRHNGPAAFLDRLAYAEIRWQAVGGQLLDDEATHVEQDRVIGQHQDRAHPTPSNAIKCRGDIIGPAYRKRGKRYTGLSSGRLDRDK